MSWDAALNTLQAHKAIFPHRFGVMDFALFESIACDQASEGSGINIPAYFDGPATSYATAEPVRKP